MKIQKFRYFPVLDFNFGFLIYFWIFQTPHSDDSITTTNLYSQCSKTLDNILKLRPESIVDGFMNIWIIKPGSSSRGRGISLDMKLENILSVVSFISNLAHGKLDCTYFIFDRSKCSSIESPKMFKICLKRPQSI